MTPIKIDTAILQQFDTLILKVFSNVILTVHDDVEAQFHFLIAFTSDEYKVEKKKCLSHLTLGGFRLELISCLINYCES